MSDHIDSLERVLREAAVREYPTREAPAQILSEETTAAREGLRGRRAGSRWWRSPLAILGAVILGGGSTAAAIALLERGSAPLTGSVPGLLARLRYDIPLTPDLEPGNAGWCSDPIFSITGTIAAGGGGTCSPAVSPGTPVILGGGEPISNEQALLRQTGHQLSARQGRLQLFWMVVSSRVAAVRLDAHEVVASRPDARLPRGWRAVVAFTSVDPNRLQPVPLDRYGRTINVSSTSSSRVIPGSGGVSPARTYAPGSSSPAPCSIDRVRLASVTAQWEVVATTTPALGSSVGRDTLFSCARSWFSIKGQTQAPSAAVLLNAQDPKHLAPLLPGLRPTDRPGIFSDASAEIVAKRVGRAWLVVQSQSVSLGRMLLSALHIGGSSLPAAHKPASAD